MTGSVIIRRLANGMPLVMEQLPHLRSVSLGVWVHTGSRDELPHEHGISHFLEHTFFKGTRRRSAEAIAQEMDALGGEMNAFTSREQTAFYVKALSDRVHEATDLMTDVLTSATFEPDQLDRERQVVTEEIRMVEDEPEEWLHDLHTAHVWGPDSALGRTILGTEASVQSFGPEQIHTYLARRYRPDRMVISAAGKLDPDALFAQLDATMGQLEARTPADLPTPPDTPAFCGHAPELHFRELEQVHLCVGGRGLATTHEDRFGMYVLNDLLGGGGSSRLFQEVREKRGLAYSVYSALSGYRDCGEIVIYAGCGPGSVSQLSKVITAEIEKVCTRPVAEDELARVKGHLKGSIVLGMESSFARMGRLAQDMINWGAPRDLDDLLTGIDGVKPEQLLRLANHAFAPDQISVTVLGALDSLPHGFPVPQPLAP